MITIMTYLRVVYIYKHDIREKENVNDCPSTTEVHAVDFYIAVFSRKINIKTFDNTIYYNLY